MPIPVGEGKFVYIDPGKDILCFDRARQHYFTIREAELALCKNVIRLIYVNRNIPYFLAIHWIPAL